MTTRDDTQSPAIPHAEHEGGAGAGAAPQLTTDQRLELVEQRLTELVEALSTISHVAGLVGNAVQTEGIGGLVKMLPALMRGA